eukprot:g16236.t1
MVNALFRSGAIANTDHFRHAIERIDPVSYLNDGYYGRWLGGVETLLVENGDLSQEDIQARTLALGGDAAARVAARPGAKPDFPRTPPGAGPGAQRKIERAPLFSVGDPVVTQPWASAGHTRLPAYARNARGVIETDHQGWVFPDSSAHGAGDDPQYLYTVRFAVTELFGPDADPDAQICIDLFEPYLGAAV